MHPVVLAKPVHQRIIVIRIRRFEAYQEQFNVETITEDKVLITIHGAVCIKLLLNLIYKLPMKFIERPFNR